MFVSVILVYSSIQSGFGPINLVDFYSLEFIFIQNQSFLVFLGGNEITEKNTPLVLINNNHLTIDIR